MKPQYCQRQQQGFNHMICYLSRQPLNNSSWGQNPRVEVPLLCFAAGDMSSIWLLSIYRRGCSYQTYFSEDCTIGFTVMFLRVQWCLLSPTAQSLRNITLLWERTQLVQIRKTKNLQTYHQVWNDVYLIVDKFVDDLWPWTRDSGLQGTTVGSPLCNPWRNEVPVFLHSQNKEWEGRTTNETVKNLKHNRCGFFAVTRSNLQETQGELQHQCCSYTNEKSIIMSKTYLYKHKE